MEYVVYKSINVPLIEFPNYELKLFKDVPSLNYIDPHNPNYNIDYGDDLLNDLDELSFHIGNFNVDSAIKLLHSTVGINLKTGKTKAATKSGHMCAKAVRMAMEAGGLSTKGRPTYGGQYGSFLKKNGWIEVNGTPQKGDIAVTRPHGNHKGGHVAMFDGQLWVSDYILRDKFVYSSANDSNTTVYRYMG